MDLGDLAIRRSGDPDLAGDPSISRLNLRRYSDPSARCNEIRCILLKQSVATAEARGPEGALPQPEDLKDDAKQQEPPNTYGNGGKEKPDGVTGTGPTSGGGLKRALSCNSGKEPPAQCRGNAAKIADKMGGGGPAAGGQPAKAPPPPMPTPRRCTRLIHPAVALLLGQRCGDCLAHGLGGFTCTCMCGSTSEIHVEEPEDDWVRCLCNQCPKTAAKQSGGPPDEQALAATAG